MLSLFSRKIAPVNPPAVGPVPAGCTESRATFRPPGLEENTVVRDPFLRDGPRLRTREFFCQEIVS